MLTIHSHTGHTHRRWSEVCTLILIYLSCLNCTGDEWYLFSTGPWGSYILAAINISHDMPVSEASHFFSACLVEQLTSSRMEGEFYIQFTLTSETLISASEWTSLIKTKETLLLSQLELIGIGEKRKDWLGGLSFVHPLPVQNLPDRKRRRALKGRASSSSSPVVCVWEYTTWEKPFAFSILWVYFFPQPDSGFS